MTKRVWEYITGKFDTRSQALEFTIVDEDGDEPDISITYVIEQ